MRLQDRVAIVTGASRGIGKSISELYAKEGAKITINYNKSEKEALLVAEELEKISKKHPELKQIKLLYKLDKALILKISDRVLDKMGAILTLKEILEEKKVDNEKGMG